MSKLSHLTGDGSAHMVDVGEKAVTRRQATARGRIRLSADAIAAIRTGNAPKGDVIATARIAGIMAAKRTAELIPLCHPLPIGAVTVDCMIADDHIRVDAIVTTAAQTGVEMEALTAVSVALLTIYDMAKAVDKGARIEGIQLEQKSGGKSGPWQRGAPDAD